jgi:hypothetical protein
MVEKSIFIFKKSDKSSAVIDITEDNIEVNEKTIELGKNKSNKNKKPKIVAYTVTRTFSGTQTFEELLAQVIRDHS